MKKRGLIFLVLLVLLVLVSLQVSASCCSNPLSLIENCQESTFQGQLFEDLCCPNSDLYNTQENYPTSKQDCINNFMTCEDKCETGCCLNPDTKTCNDIVSKVNCNGVFSKDKCDEAFSICQTGCCCTNSGYDVSEKITCTGKFIPSLDLNQCEQECKKVACIDGCQLQKPLFCKDDNLYYDCTGGDNIVGNGNDCGCPDGGVCQTNGRCETKKRPNEIKTKSSCISNNYDWCEADSKCVYDCEDCDTVSNEKNSVCIDACEDIVCGQNSFCSQGECVCEENYYVSECRLNSNIDYNRGGCYSKDPCSASSSGFSVWFLIAIVFLFIFVIMLLSHKKRPPKQSHEDQYPANYPRYPNYPQYPQHLGNQRYPR